MRIKTFVVGLAGGYEGAFEALDHLTSKMGDIEIHSCNDKFFSELPGNLGLTGNQADVKMVRTIIYN